MDDALIAKVKARAVRERTDMSSLMVKVAEDYVASVTTTQDAANTLSALMSDVVTGRTTPRVANAVSKAIGTRITATERAQRGAETRR
jgi:phage terminase large subunit-like protein